MTQAPPGAEARVAGGGRRAGSVRYVLFVARPIP